MDRFRFKWKLTKQELEKTIVEKTSPSTIRNMMERRRPMKDREVSFSSGKMGIVADFLKKLPIQAPKQSYIPGTAFLDLIQKEDLLLELPIEMTSFKGRPTMSSVLNYVLYSIAPTVWYHEEEPYLPVDAGEFYSWSPASWWDGKREREDWFKGDPLSNIAVWVATDIGTRPIRKSDRSHHAKIPKGQGFFLKPTWDTGLTESRPKWDQTAKFIESKQVTNTPCFVDIEPTSVGLLLRFWFFHCHNVWRWRSFQHQGDWEHIEVFLAIPYSSRELEIVPYDIVYFHHYFPETHVRFADSEKNDMHPLVYSGLGSHASYPRLKAEVQGRMDYASKLVDKTGRDIRWNTYDFELNPVWREDWAQFGGAWGEIRRRYSSDVYHSGPSGPMFKDYVKPVTRTRVQGMTFQLWVSLPAAKKQDYWERQDRDHYADIVHLWWIPDGISDSPVDLLQLEWYTEFAHCFHELASINPYEFKAPVNDEFDGRICRLVGGEQDEITKRVLETIGHHSIRKSSLQILEAKDYKHVRNLELFPLQAWTYSRLRNARFDSLTKYYFRTKVKFLCKPYGSKIVSTDIVPGVQPFTRNLRYQLPHYYSFRYVLNDSEGSIHDLQCGLPWHLKKIRRMQNLVSIPVFANMQEFDPRQVGRNLSYFKKIIRNNETLNGNVDTNIEIVESSIMHKNLYSKDPYRRTPVSKMKLCDFCF